MGLDCAVCWVEAAPAAGARELWQLMLLMPEEGLEKPQKGSLYSCLRGEEGWRADSLHHQFLC